MPKSKVMFLLVALFDKNVKVCSSFGQANFQNVVRMDEMRN
jgi:hypothetical protein